MSDSRNCRDILVRGVLDSGEPLISELLAEHSKDGCVKAQHINKWQQSSELTGYRTEVINEEGYQRRERSVDEEAVKLYSNYGQPRGAGHPSKPIDAMLPPTQTTEPTHRFRNPDNYTRLTGNISESLKTVLNVNKEIYPFLSHAKTTFYHNLQLRQAKREIPKAEYRAGFIKARTPPPPPANPSRMTWASADHIPDKFGQPVALSAFTCMPANRLSNYQPSLKIDDHNSCIMY